MNTTKQTLSPRRQLISSGSEFERTYNYSRAVVVGSHVMLSGTTGYNYSTGQLPVDAVDQTRQLFRNASTALAQAGAGLKDVVRVRMYISDPLHYERIMAVFAETFDGVNPACTTVQAGLFEREIFVEMDMDAILDANA
ncbi:RidA family protein [Variovorax sp. LT1R16]|uniref:RidA family protein n=1 Tax=Variovorax sp. LT1R16 TaxID=3443728 RepID=UPI003F479CF6